jgi:ABC-type polysaccharide/polyol phosphate transport system ATPase subunit
MARLDLENVWVEYPIFTVRSRSLKNKLLNISSAGRIGRGHNDIICVQALKGINLSLKSGDKAALIGFNGAGKSTLLRVMAGVYAPSFGSVYREGQVTSLLNVALGIDPESSGYENMYIRGMFLGMSRREISKRVDDIAEFSGLAEFLHMPVRTYSTGMRMRLAFAICTANDAEILLMDEWLSAGDSTFQEKARERLNAMVAKSRILVLATHSISLAELMCNKAVFLEQGEIKVSGDVKDVVATYHSASATSQAAG